MAHYVKFEVLLPTTFIDSVGSKKSIPLKEVEEFCENIRNEFGGYTESNPVSAPPFKGWWVSKDIVSIDFLISVFTLVKLEDENRAKKFFEDWKHKLEKSLSQEFILITFYPIQILGEL